MTRFQALTNPMLDAELEHLREEIGLRPNQKAELLREMAAISSWVIAQARAGRTVEARGPEGVEVLRHPALIAPEEQILLTDAEAAWLENLLEKESPPSIALQETLRRLADPDRAPPVIRWKDR
jgi:hypothetical protein